MTYLAGLARAGADGAEGAYFAALALRGWTLTLAAPVQIILALALIYKQVRLKLTYTVLDSHCLILIDQN